MFTAGELSANRRLRDYYDRFPFMEFEAVQLGRGKLRHSSQTIWGRRIIASRSMVEQRSTSMILAPDEWIMLQYPVTWTGDHRVDGHLVRKGDVFFMDGGKEWFTSGEHRDQFLIGIKREALAEACAGHAGLDAVAFAPGNRLLPQSKALSALLRRMFAALSSTAGGFARAGDRLLMPPAFEADMISALASCLISELRQGDASDDRRTATDVVAAAHDALRACRPSAIAVSDLCRSAGVGRTRLHQCFEEVYGISAGRYLTRLRLTHVRERLLDRNDPPSSVKSAALAMGFHASGRFADEYRRMFGELPSETLRD